MKFKKKSYNIYTKPRHQKSTELFHTLCCVHDISHTVHGLSLSKRPTTLVRSVQQTNVILHTTKRHKSR